MYQSHAPLWRAKYSMLSGKCAWRQFSTEYKLRIRVEDLASAATECSPESTTPRSVQSSPHASARFSSVIRTFTVPSMSAHHRVVDLSEETPLLPTIPSAVGRLWDRSSIDHQPFAFYRDGLKAAVSLLALRAKPTIVLSCSAFGNDLAHVRSPSALFNAVESS